MSHIPTPIALALGGTASAVAPQTKTFPLRNAVYVDADAATLAAQGILAYTTIESALVSWRAGGAARAVYGVPSATNPGLILIGAGQFDLSAAVVVDVPSLSLIGTGRRSTIIRATANIGTVFRSTSSNSLFRSMTLNCQGASFADVKGFEFTSGASGTHRVTDVRVENNSRYAFVLDYSGDFICEDSEIENTTGGSNGAGGFGFSGAFSGSSNIQDVEVNVATTAGEGCVNVAPNGTVLCNIKDCTFRNSVGHGMTVQNNNQFRGRVENTSIVVADTPVNVEGLNAEFLQCLMRSTGTDKHGFIVSQSGVVIHGCRIVGTGTGLAVNATGSFTTEISHCSLRMPTGDTPGSSISASITNATTSPQNSELLASTTL